MAAGRLVVAVLLGFARVAVADDDPETLTARGEELARAGEYTRAIAAFKRADTIRPSAQHACLIGLVYTRRELWSQAEIFFDRCKLRASTSDPLPSWFDAAAVQLAQKLGSVDTAEVVIKVEPAAAAAAAAVSLSMFPADETFEPRTIHVAPGSYVITVRSPGYEPRSETIAPRPGTPTVVTLLLVELMPQQGALTTKRKLGVGLASVGVASLVTGIVVGTLANTRRNDAFALCPDPQSPCGSVDRANELVRSGHGLSIGADVLFGIAGISAIGAGVLWFTGAPDSPRRLAILPSTNGITVLGTY